MDGNVDSPTTINVEGENSSSQNIVPNPTNQNETDISGTMGKSDTPMVVVVTQPQPQGEASSSASQIFGDDGDETEESKRAAESALTGAHFREVIGFHLHYKWMPCCPSLTIKPTLGHGTLAIPAEGWKMTSSSDSGCYCCFLPRARRWKTVKLMQNDKEILSFIYRPEVWCPGGKKESIVDIYVPERSKRIGWIKYDGGCDFENSKAIVADAVTKSVFHVSKKETNSKMIAMKISNNIDIPVGIAFSTKGVRYRHRGFGLMVWTDFELRCAAPMATLSASPTIKAMLLVAHTMWVLQYRERTCRKNCLIILFSIVLSLFVSFIFIIFSSNSN